jgi:membrane-bound ClpP family serine protease
MSEEGELLAYAKEQAQHFTTQADLVAEVAGFAHYSGHNQMMAERMARYVWDTTERSATVKPKAVDG